MNLTREPAYLRVNKIVGKVKRDVNLAKRFVGLNVNKRELEEGGTKDHPTWR